MASNPELSAQRFAMYRHDPSFTPRPSPAAAPRRRSRRPFWASVSRALFVAAGALVASAAACGNDGAAAPLDQTPDAGPACEQGTEGCACFFGSGCRNGLLCITGRCLMSQGADEMEQFPSTRPSIPGRPGTLPPDVDSPDASTGGPVTGGPVTPHDAGAPENAPDAAADAG